MDRYWYLILGLILLAISFVLLALNKQLRWVAICCGLAGAVFGPISEIMFYYKDYWRPPTLSGGLGVTVEHFIFGFAITVISVLIYPVVFRKEVKLNFEKPNLAVAIGLFLASFLLLAIFNWQVGINSIFVTSTLFMLCGLILVVLRRDLLKLALISGTMIMTVGQIIYMFLLNGIFAEFLHKYWLLNNSNLLIKTLIGVPITELLWFFSYGFLASIGYIYVFRGEIKTNKKEV